MRIGAKKRPFYRVVAVDERKKRTGAYLELLGTYNPLTNPHEIKLKQDRIDYWISRGAQMSDGFLRIIGKAPQKPPRKPKKIKKPEEKVEEEPIKSEDENKKEAVILESEVAPEAGEANPESKEDAGQASMTENKSKEVEEKIDERPT